MTLVRAALTLVLILLLAVPVDAQGPSAGPARPTRMVIASTRLPSVVDAPLHFRLLRVSMPAGQAGAYAGPNGTLYVLSGTLAVALDGDHRALHEGSATPRSFPPVGGRPSRLPLAFRPSRFTSSSAPRPRSTRPGTADLRRRRSSITAESRSTAPAVRRCGAWCDLLADAEEADHLESKRNEVRRAEELTKCPAP